MAFIFG